MEKVQSNAAFHMERDPLVASCVSCTLLWCDDVFFFLRKHLNQKLLQFTVHYIIIDYVLVETVFNCRVCL